LILKYTSIGLNLFPVFFKVCDYWLFNDNGIFTNIVRKNYSGEKLIINKNLESELKTYYFKSDQCIIGEGFSIKPHHIFEGISEISVYDSEKLLYLNSSVLPAINYALVMGGKKVILAGIDLDSEWKHFYEGQRCQKQSNYIDRIKTQIELFRDYIEIIKLNKNANIDVNYVDIEEL